MRNWSIVTGIHAFFSLLFAVIFFSGFFLSIGYIIGGLIGFIYSCIVLIIFRNKEYFSQFFNSVCFLWINGISSDLLPLTNPKSKIVPESLKKFFKYTEYDISADHYFPFRTWWDKRHPVPSFYKLRTLKLVKKEADEVFFYIFIIDFKKTSMVFSFVPYEFQGQIRKDFTPFPGIK